MNKASTWYEVEYILNNDFEWAKYVKHGKGTLTSKMNAKQYLNFCERAKDGQVYIIRCKVGDFDE
jgi:hypothetical protein